MRFREGENDRGERAVTSASMTNFKHVAGTNVSLAEPRVEKPKPAAPATKPGQAFNI